MPHLGGGIGSVERSVLGLQSMEVVGGSVNRHSDGDELLREMAQLTCTTQVSSMTVPMGGSAEPKKEWVMLPGSIIT